MPTRMYFSGNWTMFSETNWIQVMDGLGLFDVNTIGSNFIQSHGEKVVSNQMSMYNNYLSELSKLALIEHKTLLEQNRYVLKFE
jgi:hypothetical protein